ncbi:phosphoserine phosphatase SerB [Marinivivus vitaminiproducens]|uniref:phosphoserine phosphatase SerB n=1 Tax=Marinivivus vitaminiproducens TaxID=3035935 RepID=UPI0027A8416C|nr:phosphoserine phosphatase SerB [Geminicoccaceae bacterium SCSIO 64248]
MQDVLCLIAAPGHTLPADDAGVLARALGGEVRWLAEGRACDIVHTNRRGVLAQARDAFADRPIDTLVIASGDREKRLLLCDMDSTIITVECIDEIADFAGVKAEVAEVTRKAMNGELDFKAALKARVALLEGLSENVLAEVMSERVRLMPGARTLVRTLAARGAFTGLVSGGFTFFTERVAALCGFAFQAANVLEVRNGRLTGHVLEPIRDAAFKLATFVRLGRERDLAPAACCTVGDGANDLPMLQAAGLGIGYHAHAKVRAAIDAQINHADLTGVLHVMGLPEAAFVRD